MMKKKLEMCMIFLSEEEVITRKGRFHFEIGDFISVENSGICYFCMSRDSSRFIVNTYSVRKQIVLSKTSAVKILRKIKKSPFFKQECVKYGLCPSWITYTYMGCQNG